MAEEQGTPQVDYAALTTSLLNALGARQERAENGVVRSFSEQYGVSEAELKEIVANAKKEKDSKPTEAQQKQIDAALERANNMLISAEVKSIGSTMGLKDADVAKGLLDMSKITVKEDGTVEGVKAQLEELRKNKDYLFAAEVKKPMKTGMRQSQGEAQKGKFDDANAALRQVFGKG